MSSVRNATRRLLREIETWQAEQQAEQDKQTPSRDGQDGQDAQLTLDTLDDNSPNRGIDRLGLAADGDDLFRWEAVLNGRGIGAGYDDGRWLLSIDIPPAYPLQPPSVRFQTPILHANVHPDTGAVCLDLLQSAWSPALGVVACVRAVRLLLANPGLDSPLSVDLAALLRDGDTAAAAGLVRLWCDEQRYHGV